MQKRLPYVLKQQMPNLDSVQDCARYVRIMVGEKQNIFMPGIRNMIEGCEFSDAQKASLANRAGGALGYRLEAAAQNGDDTAFKEELEIAFWRPVVMAAAIVEQCAEQDAIAPVLKTSYAMRLYYLMANSVNNLNLMATTTPGKNSDSHQRHVRSMFNEESQFDLYASMPGEQVLNVLRRGFLRQLQMNMHIEYGLEGNLFERGLKLVEAEWDDSPSSIESFPVIRHLDRYRWMRAAPFDKNLFREETRDIYKDSPKQIEGPEEP